MTQPSNVVPLSRSLDIPFNRLVLSQANVRQVNAGISIEDLSQDIGRRGLLTAINVRPVIGAGGAETGKYEIPAGGRRFRALELLVKAKRMAKNAPVPCVIGDPSAGTSAEDDSLAENTHRVALHPLDQYRAFLTLRRQNMTEEDIAARYFVSVNVVRQRLRLAAVSPKLLALYAGDELSLDQLMAFSITGDHSRQEQVWSALQELQPYNRQPYDIKRRLRESAIEASDRRARFVGIAAYEGAGGAVLRDLFSADNGGWLQDAGLLDRLLDEKLASIADGLKSEGWKWLEIMPSLPFDHLQGLRKLTPLGPTLSEEDQSALDALKAEQADIEEAFAGYDELPDEADQRLGELETAIEAIEGTETPTFEPSEVAIAGAVVSVDRDGQALILRGYVRPEDEPSEETEATVDIGAGEEAFAPRETTVIALGQSAPATVQLPDDEGDTIRPLPEKLILELTAFRTMALRDAVARSPRVAMTLLLHKLIGDTFGHRYGGACLQVHVSYPQLVGKTQKDLDETVPAATMAHRKSLWADVIPYDDQALWDWLEAESDEVRAELLAFCVSFGINALMERPDTYGAGPSQHRIDCRLKQASRVAQATGLDLVAIGWRPTADTYLNRVPRARILEAVREGCGERSAQLIDHLKKGDMVVEAERLLADAGWLPEVLRGPEPQESLPTQEGAALPAFLSDNEEDGTAAPIAAE